MGEISMSGQSVVRTPMYALARNRRFCPAAPMKKAPTTVLDSLHHCWGPNWHKTTVKKIQWCLMLGTLADDLSCPVQPPSLVLRYFSFRKGTVDTRLTVRVLVLVLSNIHTSTRTVRSSTWAWEHGMVGFLRKTKISEGPFSLSEHDLANLLLRRCYLLEKSSTLTMPTCVLLDIDLPISAPLTVMSASSRPCCWSPC